MNNEHSDICFLNNFKFLYKIPFKVISFFCVSSYIMRHFYLDLNDFST